MVKQNEEKKNAVDLALAKKVARRAAAIGFVIGLICNFLPHEYRAVCHAIANVCMGG